MKTHHIALIIFVGLCLWMATGLLKNHGEHSTEAEQNKEEKITAVRVVSVHAEEKEISMTLRGKTKAKRIVDVTAQIAGVVKRTAVERGQHVSKGDVLCELDEEDRYAQLARAKASVEKAQIDYDGNKKLYDEKMISAANLSASKAILEAEKSQLKVAELNVSYLSMRAPFDAYIESREANEGALIERGGVCARLIDESTMLASAHVSEKQVQALSLGQTATIQLIDGRTIAGVISFLGRSADPSTRTYGIEVELSNKELAPRDGLTAKISIPLRKVMAHHITPAVLALNEQGEVGVKIVDRDNRVQLVPVEIVAEDVAGVWVVGLEPEVNLIVVGQELVADKERVSVSVSVSELNSPQDK